MLLGRRLGALGAASPRPAARPLGAARPLATPAAAAPAGRVVGGANLDWGRLPFNYHETAAVVRYEWADGVWDAGTEHADPHVKVHLLSHIINFGQGCFEGLKVFHTQDGRVVAFNPTCNARRLQSSAARLSLPQVPEELFLEGVERAIRANLEYVPPYGSGGAMYVRPVLFGHGAEMHLVAPPRATFAVAATPVGPFFPREAGLKPVSALVVTDYDRAATRGTGRYKVGGNYSPDMLVSGRTRSKGFDVSLFLDSATQSYVDVRARARAASPAAPPARPRPRAPTRTRRPAPSRAVPRARARVRSSRWPTLWGSARRARW